MPTSNAADTTLPIARPAKGGSGSAGRPFGRGGKKRKVSRGKRKAAPRKTGTRKAAAGKRGRRKPARRAKKRR